MVVLLTVGGIFGYFFSGGSAPWEDSVPSNAAAPWGEGDPLAYPGTTPPDDASERDAVPASPPDAGQAGTEPAVEPSETGSRLPTPSEPTPSKPTLPAETVATIPDQVPEPTPTSQPAAQEPSAAITSQPTHGQPVTAHEVPQAEKPNSAPASSAAIRLPEGWPIFSTASPEMLRVLSSLRASLVRRDVANVREQIARKMESATQGDLRDLKRMDLIAYQLEIFWKGVEQGLESLKPADELSLPQANWHATVHEKFATSLVLKRDGKLGKAVPIDRRNIRAGLAAAIAEKHLKDRGAGRLITLAVFWSLEPGKRPDIAEQYWQRALDAGLAVEALAPELLPIGN